MPSLAAVLIMRQAISPRLAIMILLNIDDHHPDDVESFAPLTPMIGAKAGRTIEAAEPQPATPGPTGGGLLLPEPQGGQPAPALAIALQAAIIAARCMRSRSSGSISGLSACRNIKSERALGVSLPSPPMRSASHVTGAGVMLSRVMISIFCCVRRAMARSSLDCSR